MIPRGLRGRSVCAMLRLLLEQQGEPVRLRNLADVARISQPSVAGAMKPLRDAGVVIREHGEFTTYRLATGRAEQVMALLDRARRAADQSEDRRKVKVESTVAGALRNGYSSVWAFAAAKK